MPPHPFTNSEIQRYYQNEPRFNGVFSRNNLPLKIKDGAYVINLDEYVDVGTPWIALFCNRNEIIYFDSFGVENVPKEIKEFVIFERKIKSCRKSSKRFIEFKKKLGLVPVVVTCDEQDIISAMQVAFEREIIIAQHCM